MARNRANGEGTVYVRKNRQGKTIGYCGSYWVQTADGPKRRYVSGKTKTEALVALRKATADRDGGLAFDAKNLSLGVLPRPLAQRLSARYCEAEDLGAL
jgi:integrase